MEGVSPDRKRHSGKRARSRAKDVAANAQKEPGRPAGWEDVSILSQVRKIEELSRHAPESSIWTAMAGAEVSAMKLPDAKGH